MPQKKIYLVWVVEEGDEAGHWEQYSSLEDAVDSHGAGCEVWFARPRRLGKFRAAKKILKIKTRRKAKK